MIVHKPIKILLVEDQVMFSETMAESLSKDPNIVITETLTTGDAALRYVSDNEVDLILMDIRMPEGQIDGLDAAKEILKQYRGVKIIMLSAHKEGYRVSQAFNAGVHGYVLKGESRKTLLEAIQQVIKGGTYFRGDVMKAMNDYMVKNRGTSDDTIKLTATQQEILEALAKGMNSREIAEARNRQPDTIIVQRRALLAKFNVRNVAELIKEAIRRGFIKV